MSKSVLFMPLLATLSFKLPVSISSLAPNL